MKNWIQNAFDVVRYSLARILRGSSGSKSPIIAENHPAADQLRSIITKAKEHASDAQTTLGNLGSRLQVIIDDADVAVPLVSYIEPAKIEGLAVLWDEVSRQTGYIQSSLKEVYSITDAVSGTASLTSVTISGILSRDIIPFSADPSFRDAWVHFTEVTNRPTLKDEVINLIRTFHLDIAPPAKKSPLELFQIAHRAFEFPVSQSNPVITSLLPMREAVESALDELLRLRPRQEVTGSSYSKKILSIGTQLKKGIISDVVVQEWTDQWHDISDKDLSASKRYQMTREEWSRKLNRATQFLFSFLIGIDPSKLRR